MHGRHDFRLTDGRAQATSRVPRARRHAAGRLDLREQAVRRRLPPRARRRAARPHARAHPARRSALHRPPTAASTSARSRSATRKPPTTASPSPPASARSSRSSKASNRRPLGRHLLALRHQLRAGKPRSHRLPRLHPARRRPHRPQRAAVFAESVTFSVVRDLTRLTPAENRERFRSVLLPREGLAMPAIERDCRFIFVLLVVLHPTVILAQGPDGVLARSPIIRHRLRCGRTVARFENLRDTKEVVTEMGTGRGTGLPSPMFTILQSRHICHHPIRQLVARSSGPGRRASNLGDQPRGVLGGRVAGRSRRGGVRAQISIGTGNHWRRVHDNRTFAGGYTAGNSHRSQPSLGVENQSSGDRRDGFLSGRPNGRARIHEVRRRPVRCCRPDRPPRL